MGEIALMSAGLARPTPGCAKQPRERRPYYERPINGVSDAAIMGLSDDDLLILRDKVAHAIGVRGTERLAVPPVIRSIILKAASDAGVSPLDVLGRRKTDGVIFARKRAMASCYALRRPDGERRFSYNGLARYFRRDWTTVEYAVRNFDGDLIEATE